MSLQRRIRYLLHRYRFEDFPPETQEAILQVEEFEASRADMRKKDRSAIPGNAKGQRYELYESPMYIEDRECLEKRGHDLSGLDEAIALLLDGERLPRRYKIHGPESDSDGLWNCHMKGGWILLYRYSKERMILEAVRI